MWNTVMKYATRQQQDICCRLLMLVHLTDPNCELCTCPKLCPTKLLAQCLGPAPLTLCAMLQASPRGQPCGERASGQNWLL